MNEMREKEPPNSSNIFITYSFSLKHIELRLGKMKLQRLQIVSFWQPFYVFVADPKVKNTIEFAA